VVAPSHIDVEVAHAVRGQVLRGVITSGDGGRVIATRARLGVRRVGVVAVLGRIWSLRDHLSAYDAAYVAIADSLGCHLVTADARLARAPGLRCAVTVVPR
jgi:predicted nucleic acid-binding protein